MCEWGLDSSYDIFSTPDYNILYYKELSDNQVSHVDLLTPVFDINEAFFINVSQVSCLDPTVGSKCLLGCD